MTHKKSHQSKKLKSHKPAVPNKPASQLAGSQPAVTSQPALAVIPVKPAPAKAIVAQEAAAVRFAELPYELRRIALFSASVVVLLIVLWFFLK